ncbi:MAG: hypothetical protein NTY19_27915 [Planctomycetota bacterium]|nr:hypothetical protein [Planctomycetota bacterium]
MQLVITPDGTVRCVYTEDLDLHTLGQLTISRGSRIAAKPWAPNGTGWNPAGWYLRGPEAGFVLRQDLT